LLIFLFFHLENDKIENAERTYQKIIKNQTPYPMITGQTYLNPHTGKTLHMVLQLAEKYYKVPSLHDQLISNRPKRISAMSPFGLKIL